MTLFDQPGHSATGTSGSHLSDVSRIRMVVAYDGTGFRGFAAQPGVVTIGGRIAEALEQVVGHQVELTCAGRTDAGVHAWGQVLTTDVSTERADPERLVASLNRMCAPQIVVRWAEVAPDGFDARFSAVARTYRYTVLNRPVPDPFLASTSWHVAEPLDMRSMRAAGDPLIGEHDFSSFCRAAQRRDGSVASLVRRVHDLQWEESNGGVLRFTITASAFCHQMVRSVVGTLVEVGSRRRRAGEMTGILSSRDRQSAGQIAPPHGLCLWSVEYPGPWHSDEGPV